MLDHFFDHLHDPQPSIEPIIEVPTVLCQVCDAILIESMSEEGRDELIEALTGETIFHTTAQRVCLDCYLKDDTESPYIKADYHG